MSDADRPESKRFVLKKKGPATKKKKVTGKRPLTQIKKKAPPAKPTDTSPMAKPLVEAPPPQDAPPPAEAAPPPAETAPPPAKAKPTPAKAKPPPAPAAEETSAEQEEEPEAEGIEFFCPYCAKSNIVARGEEGEAISCGNCRNTITVPPPLAEAPKAVEEPAAKSMLRFFCSICGQKLSAPADAAGAKTVCPSCNSSIAVPDNQPAPPESQDDREGNDSFKFHCQGCGKKFEARRSWAGRPFVCPSCDAKNTVPDPRT